MAYSSRVHMQHALCIALKMWYAKSPVLVCIHWMKMKIKIVEQIDHINTIHYTEIRVGFS